MIEALAQQRPDTTALRSVLGHFASGVTVVTGSGPGSPVGFTCQSFSALSLDPPQVLVLPSRTSNSWPRIARSRRFCVNVLAEDQREVSALFARPGVDRFAELSWTTSPLGSPVLPGACAWIDCELADVYPGGDHWIIVGRVRHCQADGRPPLVFHRGEYRGLRECLRHF